MMVLLAPTAFADEDNHWYVVAAAGPSNFRDFCSIAQKQTAVDSCDDESVGWQVLLGRTFGKMLAVEAGYIDTGEATAYESGGSGTMKLQSQLLALTGLFSVPIGKLSLFAKLGGVYYDAETRFTGGFSSATGLASKQETGIGTTFGGGAEWNFSRRFAFRAEYAGFDIQNVWQGDSELVMLGLRINF
ncbi:MAG: outer membrane beta-barrel protein [Burkholderiales bacterium]